MEKLIRALSSKNKERIKLLCDQYDKTYEELKDNKIIIRGENLDGLLDDIRMNLLGEILNVN